MAVLQFRGISDHQYRPKKQQRPLWQLAQKIRGCKDCKLGEQRLGATVPGVGSSKPNPPLLLLGEAPGAHEAKQGKPFVGPSGMLLQGVVREIGLTKEDLWVLNTVKCRPPNNRNPTTEELTTCGEKFLIKQIETINPQFILCVGRVPTVALHLLSGEQLPSGSLRGLSFLFKKYPCMTTWHPAYVIRQPSKRDELKEDILYALRCIEWKGLGED